MFRVRGAVSERYGDVVLGAFSNLEERLAISYKINGDEYAGV